MGSFFGKLTILVGIAAGVLFMVSGGLLWDHGQRLVELESQAGNSVAEAYYNEVGHCNKAYGMMAFGSGLGITAVSVGLGVALIKRYVVYSAREIDEEAMRGSSGR